MLHIIASLLLATIGGVITYALDYVTPWPYIVGVIVFLAYCGFCFFIIDEDWDW